MFPFSVAVCIIAVGCCRWADSEERCCWRAQRDLFWSCSPIALCRWPPKRQWSWLMLTFCLKEIMIDWLTSTIKVFRKGEWVIWVCAVLYCIALWNIFGIFESLLCNSALKYEHILSQSSKSSNLLLSWHLIQEELTVKHIFLKKIFCCLLRIIHWQSCLDYICHVRTWTSLILITETLLSLPSLQGPTW